MTGSRCSNWNIPFPVTRKSQKIIVTLKMTVPNHFNFETTYNNINCVQNNNKEHNFNLFWHQNTLGEYPADTLPTHRLSRFKWSVYLLSVIFADECALFITGQWSVTICLITHCWWQFATLTMRIALSPIKRLFLSNIDYQSANVCQTFGIALCVKVYVNFEFHFWFVVLSIHIILKNGRTW